MKTMKLWRNILVMTAAMLSFASCSSDDDEVFFTIGTDGIPMPATYHNVSQADFQKFIVGYCWKETEMHRINDDGSIEEKDYGWDLFGWCGPSYYEFGDQTIIHYVENTGIPAYVHYTMNYKYDYSNNIYINDNNHLYFRLISVSETTVKVIKWESETTYREGGYKPEFLYVVLKRLTNKEQADVKEQYSE